MKKEISFSVETPMSLLDFLLTHMSRQSRNSVKHLLSRRQVLVDNIPEKQFDFQLSKGQMVTVLPQAKGATLPFPILYEDDGILVIQKPSGLLTVSTESQKSHTAYHMVFDYLQARNPKNRPFIVHRLDRDTSGVLLFAKSFKLKEELQNDWNTLVKKRRYLAIVEGENLPNSGICSSQLTENRIHRVYSTKSGNGKNAITRYTVITHTKGYSLLDLELDTGRKNQIRVHMSEMGHPVIGDKKYGATSSPLGRLGLHACELVLTDPRTGKILTFTAPIPTEFKKMFPQYFFNAKRIRDK